MVFLKIFKLIRKYFLLSMIVTGLLIINYIYLKLYLESKTSFFKLYKENNINLIPTTSTDTSTTPTTSPIPYPMDAMNDIITPIKVSITFLDKFQLMWGPIGLGKN